MKCSEDNVSKIFAKMPGVIDLGRAGTRQKGQYRILRIPKTVLEAYLSRKAGRTITVNVVILLSVVALTRGKTKRS
jgi:hypothetical protein